ncbi:hypothetical protein RAA17_03270 [Komagataeibacter rhaeticus]|nr:hypothetical protein [Komagataeibacter rhaeticus]
MGRACDVLPQGHNIGLILRWQAALAEMAALSAIPRALIHDRLQGFLTAVAGRITADPALELLPPWPLRGPCWTMPGTACPPY